MMNNLSSILALARKDLVLLRRDKVNLFFTVAFPILMGLFFGAMYSGMDDGPRVNVAVVDLDHSKSSEAFAADLKHTDGIIVSKVATVDEGRELVRKGKQSAVIVLPKGFGDSFANIFRGEPATVEGFIDPSQQATSGLLIGRLNELAFRRLVDGFTDPAQARKLTQQGREQLAKASGLNMVEKAAINAIMDSVDRLAEDTAAVNADTADSTPRTSAVSGFNPVKIDLKSVVSASDETLKGLKSSFQLSFPSAIAWALLGAVTAFSSSFVSERQQGTYIRLVTSPLKPIAVLMGKCSACFITALGCTSVMIGIMSLQAPPGSWPLLALAVISACLGFTGLMAFLAVMLRTGEGASGAARAVLLVLALIGGGSLPLAFMPSWMLTITSVSPFKWAIMAIEGAVWRGFGLQEMLVPCGVLLGFGAMFFFAGLSMFSRQLARGTT